jgi:chloride channel 3/4/5
LFFQSESGVIKTIIGGFEGFGITMGSGLMSVFLGIWFLFTCVTYGAWIPAGLFLPGIIIGCGVGSFYETLRVNNLAWGQSYSVAPIIIGAGAMLSSYSRFTYSLVVVMLETTSAINLFIPMMLAMGISRGVSSLFTKSLYEIALVSNQVPILH